MVYILLVNLQFIIKYFSQCLISLELYFLYRENHERVVL